MTTGQLPALGAFAAGLFFSSSERLQHGLVRPERDTMETSEEFNESKQSAAEHICKVCGTPTKMCAYNDCGEWVLDAVCECQHTSTEIPWPWENKENATGEEFEALGFEIA